MITPTRHMQSGRRAIGALVVACALLVACEETHEPYRIGVVLEEDGVRGAQIAADALNARGGIDGHPLELVPVTDSSSTTARVALRAAESLVSDPTVLAIVGHSNSSASLAASQVYNARHVTQIAPTTTAPLYSQAGPYSFRLVASDAYQGAYLARLLLSSPRSRTAVVFVNDDYGRALAGVLRRELHSAGADPAYVTSFAESRDFPDRDDILRALTIAHPDVLVWIGRPNEFAHLAPGLHRALPRLSVLASDGFGSALMEKDSLHVLAGVRYVRLVDLSRPDSALERFLQRYRGSGMGRPTDQAVLAHDAVLLLGEGLRHATTRESIRDWVATVGHGTPPVAGLSGPIAFGSGGDRAPVYALEETPPRPAPPGAAGAARSRPEVAHP